MNSLRCQFESFACRKQSPRRGAAVVELSVLLPVVTFLILGSIQTANLIYLQQAITAIAHQGALDATRPKADETTILSRMQDMLDARSLEANAVTVGYGTTAFADIEPGELFEVTISASIQDNLILHQIIPVSGDLQATLTGIKQ